ncbi:hypothetical protein HU200_066360 [Digitaria exilis]|uniref:Uncharacterized protein n=1 Tax=Digitaria exilis TaxID=1010633 RepID=A0A835A7S7_9POAL|nr:hypothetical protein HU200_066360 [Digitaria exilis]
MVSGALLERQDNLIWRRVPSNAHQSWIKEPQEFQNSEYMRITLQFKAFYAVSTQLIDSYVSLYYEIYEYTIPNS